MLTAAAFVAAWVLAGEFVISNVHEFKWAGVPRWRAVLLWPAAIPRKLK